MRFTLCKLFLGVTMAALASAGMTLHTRLWAEAIVSFSVVLYAAVAILSFRGGGQVRAFRVAFAVVGGAYLLLVLCNTFTPIRDLLLTNRALIVAGRALQVSTQVQFQGVTYPTYTPPITPMLTSGKLSLANGLTFSSVSSFDEWENTFGFGTATPSLQIPAGAFLIIGHCLWSWLLALAAGCFAAFVYRPRTPIAA